MSRCNDSVVALGNLRRVSSGLPHLLLSPDMCMWLVPTGITLGLAAGTLYTVGFKHSWLEIAMLLIFLLVAFVSSLLVTTTDPGVYPRLAPGERDPLENEANLPMCKICNMKRPPRCAHCYSCNVCVLEHDHHCGIVGGCVGQRSLRWFTLYLVSITCASVTGFYWLLMSVISSGGDAAPVTDRARIQTASLSTAGHIGLLIFIGNIVLMVGGLAVYYLYLMMSDTTRREAQGKLQRPQGISGAANRAKLWLCGGLVNNFTRVMFPPTSRIVPQRQFAAATQAGGSLLPPLESSA